MKTQFIGKTAALKLIQETKGRFFGVTFKKQDGKVRTMNAQYNSSTKLSELGYIKLNDRNDKGQLKNVNLQTISKLTIKGQIYKVK